MAWFLSPRSPCTCGYHYGIRESAGCPRHDPGGAQAMQTAREAVVARARQVGTANGRARNLLEEYLTEEQRRQARATHRFVVRGSRRRLGGRRRYSIRVDGRYPLVRRVDNHAGYCMVPAEDVFEPGRDRYPDADVALAAKLMIENDERLFLTIAKSVMA